MHVLNALTIISFYFCFLHILISFFSYLAALSDVNSMIDYNDCNDNRYRGRRQSSLSSNSVCPYASDSFCEDDDDYNDDDEYIFWDGYRVEDEKFDFGDDDNNDGRYNIRLFQQQQVLSSQPTPQTPPDDASIDNNNEKYVCFYVIQSCLTI